MQFKSIKKLLLALCVIAFSASNCLAVNVLSQIEISPSDNNGYNISFGAQKPSEVKKIVSSDNKMILEMKGISVSSAYNTIYNNVVDVDSVVVEAINKNSTKVIFEGKNIAKSQIFFETIQGENVVGNSQQSVAGSAIELSRPVSEYAPVYSKEFVEDLQTEENFSQEIKASALSLIKNQKLRRYAKAGLKKVANNATKENLAYILLGIGFIALVIKVLRPSNKQEPASIGLAQSLKQKEIARLDNMDIATKIQERKQKMQESPINTNANYAMKTYQASQKNPYTSSMHRPVAKRPVTAQPVQRTNENRVVKRPVTSIKSDLQQSTKVTTPVTETKKMNVDSMKFLESMAKIYEKNGRMDLAKGLKANMKKADLQKQLI